MIEFQHSSINGAQIEEREVFYRRMVWLFDAVVPYSEERLLLYDQGTYWTFRWKHPRKGVAFAQSPAFLDLGDQLLEVRRIYRDERCGGWGRLLSYDEFVHRFASPSAA